MANKTYLRLFPSAEKRRKFLEKELKITLPKIAQFNFTEEEVTGRNIENLIGSTQIPLGVAGPIRVKSLESSVKEYYIPLATTEGALVASVSRGCKAITQSGGATTEVENVGITRGPVFKTTGIQHCQQIIKWINENLALLSLEAQKTSSFLTLKKVDCSSAGRNLFARFYFDTTDAMGMNMATFATTSLINLIEKYTGTSCVSVAGNFDIDKKPAWLNFISGRGKKVWAECILNKTTVEKVLKTTPQQIVEVSNSKCLLGSAMAGSLGFNSHFANIIAAVFAATGQDLAHVVEGSLGVTTAEILDDGGLYFSIYLPSLVVGTVGGGTHLPTQQEALQIMQVTDVLKYAGVLGAAVLAGELSLLASLSEGSLAKAHKRLGKGQVESLK